MTPTTPPPAHEDTLGALGGVPKEVAEEYNKTGKTPRAYVKQQMTAAATAEDRAKAVGTTPEKAAVAAEAEETVHGRPLSYYDGKSDEQILAIPGVGEATLHDIKRAQKKAARR